MKKIYPLACALLLLCSLFASTRGQLQAQDIHFSQFYADPIRLNPALTGNFNGKYRFGLNGRSQWSSVSTPFQTIGAYADISLFSNDNFTWVGTGLRLLYDRAGDGLLSTSEVQLSAALHQAFTESTYISLGAALTFMQKRVDISALSFSSQWNDISFDTSLPNLEAIEYASTQFIDAQAGFSVSHNFGKANLIHFGFGALHINRPSVSFYEENNQLGTRITANISGVYAISPFVSFEPAAYYTTQKSAREIIIGANTLYSLSGGYGNSPLKLYAGLWYRNQDALIALTGLDVNNNRLLLSYDITTSKLRTAAQYRGGFEISFVHIGGLREKPRKIYCPRF